MKLGGGEMCPHRIIMPSSSLINNDKECAANVKQKFSFRWIIQV